MSRPQATETVPQQRHLLFESMGVSVVDFRCRAHVEPPGPEEPQAAHGIAFVRSGVFRRWREREALVADANHVLFFNAAEPYRYAHPLPGGDDCTVLSLETGRALELVARHAPRDAEDEASPFRLGHALSSLPLARLQYELLALLRGPAPRLEVEDAVAELAGEAVRAAYRDAASRQPRPSTAARRKRREQVEAARLAVNARVEAAPTLDELARDAGCSPFHLSRIFRDVTGLSLRAYAKRLRARRAAERLAAGARDLTELALELGYADHSHFTNAFREEWGVPPSAFRTLARPR